MLEALVPARFHGFEEGSGSEVRGDKGRQLGLGNGADLRGGGLAVLEQDQRRDAANGELGRRLRVFINIQLDDLELAGGFGRHLLEDRGIRITHKMRQAKEP